MKLKYLLLLNLFLILRHASAQESNFLTFKDTETFKLQGYLQFGVNAVAETNLFWNLADVPELDYDSDTQWLESYAKPGIGFTLNSENSIFYGQL